MSQYYATIDNNESFPLFFWDAQLMQNSQQLKLATDDLAHVRQVFESFSTITITDSNDETAAVFNQFNGYSSINYMGRNYSSQIDGFANELIITLTKVDIVQLVEQLDKQINPVIDFDAMTLDEYKEWKIEQFSMLGEQLIFDGTEVVLINGVKKDFTYNLEDQSNLLNAIFIIQALDNTDITLPYHGHAEPCELYNALDILLIYITLQTYSTKIQTVVNMRNNWVRSCETKEEAMAINFDTPLPEEWQERADGILEPAKELVAKLIEKYFPNMVNSEDVDGAESSDEVVSEEE